MFQAMRMLYLYTETALHVGIGRGLGGVDLPIQRERTTGYPIVYAGGLKGCLRSETDGIAANHRAIFGPDTVDASDHAGALAPHDARLLLLPMRSMEGVFAWATSVDALQRFVRALHLGLGNPPWQVPTPVNSGQALVAPATTVACAGKVVLEDFALTPSRNALVQTIGTWLADNALPTDAQYAYWRDQLPGKLCILNDSQFQQFCLLAMEVATRVQLNDDTKTVKEGPWTEENLPVDALLYAPVLATQARDASGLSATAILDQVVKATPALLQLGGNETIGRGLVRVRWSAGGAL